MMHSPVREVRICLPRVRSVAGFFRSCIGGPEQIQHTGSLSHWATCLRSRLREERRDLSVGALLFLACHLASILELALDWRAPYRH